MGEKEVKTMKKKRKKKMMMQRYKGTCREREFDTKPNVASNTDRS